MAKSTLKKTYDSTKCLRIEEIPLEKFCSKKLLQVEYLTAVAPEDDEMLKALIKIGKEYEDLSGVLFITYDDVLDLIRRSETSEEENVQLPDYIENYLKTYLQGVAQDMLSNNATIPVEILAVITKIKIIENMYKKYSKEVTSMMRRKELHEELAQLINDSGKDEKQKKAKGKKEKKKKSKKDKSSKSSKDTKNKKRKSKGKEKGQKQESTSVFLVQPKEPVVDSMDDYTEITLPENEVIFDYNVDKHVQYVVLSGFPDTSIFEELSKLRVMFSSIIELSTKLSNSENTYEFVKQLHNMFDFYKTTSYFENTALMEFQSSNESAPMKEILKELIYVIYRINYIQRQHLHYIKNLTLQDLGEKPKKLKPECLEKYNRILNSYPSELVNVVVIVDALIEEVCWRELGPIYSLSDLSTNSTSVTNRSLKETKEKQNNSYQVHEEDYCKMVLNSYKIVGRQFYDKNMEYLKFLKPLMEATDQVTESRTKTRAVSTEEHCYCSGIKDFINYIHLSIFCHMKRTSFVPKIPEKYDFTRNIINYNESKRYDEVQPRILGKATPSATYKQNNDVLWNYHLKEDLSTSVLRQMIFKALLNYTCYDKYYCEESDSVLLRFHDNLNEFGIETKMWNKFLRTPVCLRDFCKFITLEDREWLKKHQLKEHQELNEDKVDEICEGLKDMHVPELYKEYQYLLGDSSGTLTEEKKKVFSSVLEELQTYPDSSILNNFCATGCEPSSFIAYDLGSTRLQLDGHTTIFRSDDDVKVTVDASRFLTEEGKCSININSDDNHLVFHSINPTAFHIILRDETFIRFSKFNIFDEEIFKYASESELLSANELEEEKEATVTISEEVEEEEEEENKAVLSSLNNYADDYWVQILRKCKVPNILPNFFSKVNVLNRKLELDNRNLDALLEAFKTAVYMRRPIYKISTKRSLHLLERKLSPTTISFAKILKRVFFKPLRKKKRIIRGYSVVNFPPLTKKKQILEYDFQINLPNGLIVSTLPRKRELVEIKQTNKYCESEEEYRIFYASGTILIKNLDGTTTIYKSNGDVIQLSDKSNKDYNIKCTENMKDIFGKLENEICPFKLSRCDPPVVKDADDYKGLSEYGAIPYKMVTLLKFDGKKTTIFEGKLTENQAYYVLTERDYHSSEIFFEREDGLKCLINKKGERIIQFPDGTKITAVAKMEKDLIFFSKNPKAEGWVSIIINYKVEHPNYIPTTYDAYEKSTQLFLAGSIIKHVKNSVLLTTEKNVVLEVNTENVIFLKTCGVCNCDCICKINFNVEAGEKLLEVCDSYNKYFACDREGNCQIHADYIKGSKNKKKCDHRWNHEDKKMFVLNKKGPPGTLLWKDSLVEEKMYSDQRKKNVKVLNYMNKLTRKQNIEFFREVYQKFHERFTMTYLSENKISLSKYKQPSIQKNTVCYVTFRMISEFQELVENPDVQKELFDFIETNPEMFSPFVLDGIVKMLHLVFIEKNVKDDRFSYRSSMQEPEDFVESESSVFSKSIDLDTPTAAEIIDKWRRAIEHSKYLIRNKIFPCYFDSDYYKHVLKSRKTS